ncbi:MAG: DUF1572 family protein [Bacteroidetes bacterium]|nr:DUF1572 family protein [Bacteroidota bacterium]
MYTEILLREIQKLEDEIKRFDETSTWKTTGEITNSAGNLCLHLCGNLQHFIGAVLGKSGYVRNREQEFASKGMSKENLLLTIHQTKATISEALQKITADDLQKTYPQNFLGREVTAGYFLLHLLSHFDYHLGQINYLRRAL